jgi:hypothetical protein
MMIWPGYLPFAKVRPLVLGMPFGLFYYAALLAASFGVLLALYRWEIRRGLDEGEAKTKTGHLYKAGEACITTTACLCGL